MRFSPQIKPAHNNCTGCGKLFLSNEQIRGQVDHEEEGFNHEARILFVSDSYKYEAGELTPFTMREEALIFDTMSKLGFNEYVPFVEFTAAVKCPNIKDKDMNTADKEICRKNIQATISVMNPDIIFVCGNLPLNMVTKKTGITMKRGKVQEYYHPDTEEQIPVFPILHPIQVLAEPKNAYLFDIDIQNGIEQFVIKNKESTGFKYQVLNSVEELTVLAEAFKFPGERLMAVDLETQGLAFKTHKTQTVSMSFQGTSGDINTLVVPVYHNESLLEDDGIDIFVKMLSTVMADPTVMKVFHKANFDLKFLMGLGITEFNNICDTKLMQHSVDENVPKSLKDLVSYYFQSEQHII
jgi:uracil-DNA glycosylase family 4